MAKLRRYCGNYILEITNGTIREYGGKINGNKVKRYCGNYIYEIDGFLSHQELMALIAILFA